MSWTACYNNICQTHQSDKSYSEWYSKLSKQSLHVTQVKRHVDSLTFRSDSEESYKVIKFFTTKKKSRGNHYSSNNSHEDFSQEELQKVWDIIWEINNQMTEKMSESEQEYSAEL